MKKIAILTTTKLSTKTIQSQGQSFTFNFNNNQQTNIKGATIF